MGRSIRSSRGVGGPGFGQDGRVQDYGVRQQLHTLGEEVVRVAEKFTADTSVHRQAECERAAELVASLG